MNGNTYFFDGGTRKSKNISSGSPNNMTPLPTSFNEFLLSILAKSEIVSAESGRFRFCFHFRDIWTIDASIRMVDPSL